MRQIVTALLIVSLFTGIAFAQGNPVTGNEWLKVDKNTRGKLVTNFIQEMKTHGVTISKDVTFYCQKLDKLYAKKPNLLAEPVWKVLKTAMIMENDWKVKGQDPDAAARDWLGEKLYNKWKEKYAGVSPR